MPPRLQGMGVTQLVYPAGKEHLLHLLSVRRV